MITLITILRTLEENWIFIKQLQLLTMYNRAYNAHSPLKGLQRYTKKKVLIFSSLVAKESIITIFHFQDASLLHINQFMFKCDTFQMRFFIQYPGDLGRHSSIIMFQNQDVSLLERHLQMAHLILFCVSITKGELTFFSTSPYYVAFPYLGVGYPTY